MLDDSARETFPTGRPLEDSPDLQQCKHCKKSILKTAAKTHLTACLKAKREKAQRKKEQKEAREREKKEAGGEGKKDAEGDTKMDGSDDDDDDDTEKKGPSGLKSAKKSAGKNVDAGDATKKGKKRKADGDAEKGPKQKKKKEEPKPKAPKPKGMVSDSVSLRKSSRLAAASSRAFTVEAEESLSKGPSKQARQRKNSMAVATPLDVAEEFEEVERVNYIKTVSDEPAPKAKTIKQVVSIKPGKAVKKVVEGVIKKDITSTSNVSKPSSPLNADYDSWEYTWANDPLSRETTEPEQPHFLH